jgi:hypothetical protein
MENELKELKEKVIGLSFNNLKLINYLQQYEELFKKKVLNEDNETRKDLFTRGINISDKENELKDRKENLEKKEKELENKEIDLNILEKEIEDKIKEGIGLKVIQATFKKEKELEDKEKELEDKETKLEEKIKKNNIDLGKIRTSYNKKKNNILFINLIAISLIVISNLTYNYFNNNERRIERIKEETKKIILEKDYLIKDLQNTISNNNIIEKRIIKEDIKEDKIDIKKDILEVKEDNIKDNGKSGIIATREEVLNYIDNNNDLNIVLKYFFNSVCYDNKGISYNEKGNMKEDIEVKGFNNNDGFYYYINDNNDMCKTEKGNIKL